MTFEECIRAGGVVVFPADTVYGLACDPENAAAVERLYALKGRPPNKPSALMAFSFESLPPIPERARRLLPGPVTLLVPGDAGTIGIRYPAGTPIEGSQVVVLQSSANHSGGPDARTLDEVPRDIRDGADLVIDGGPLPGTPSTVIDFTTDPYRIVREGALSAADVASILKV
jgi:L-threonylcarbamoyladenylate synthase